MVQHSLKKFSKVLALSTVFAVGQVVAAARGGSPEQELHEALGRLDVEQCRAILEANKDNTAFNINEKNKCGWTPLMVAVSERNPELVQLISIYPGVDVNCTTDVGYTPLHYAAEMGDVAIVRLLLQQQRTAIEEKDGNGRTPFWLAVRAGRTDVVRAFLDNPGKVDYNYNAPKWFDKTMDNGKTMGCCAGDGCCGPTNGTPLIAAASKGFEDIVQLLLRLDNIDLNAQDSMGETALHHAVQNGHLRVVQLLKEKGGLGLNVKYPGGDSLLHVAARMGAPAIVQELLDFPGIDVDLPDVAGHSAVDIAEHFNHPDIEKMLRARGGTSLKAFERSVERPVLTSAQKRERLQEAAKTGDLTPFKGIGSGDQWDYWWQINAYDSDKRTPLILATVNGHKNFVNQLLSLSKLERSHQLRMNAMDKFGKTALDYALGQGNRDIVDLLTKAGCKRASETMEGQLCSAAYRGDLERVKALVSLEKKINTNHKDGLEFGQTPLIMASKNGHLPVVQYLLGLPGIEINAPDFDGRTPLWWAASAGHAGVVRCLLAQPDIEVNVKPNSRLNCAMLDGIIHDGSPLFEAVTSGHAEVVQLLLGQSGININAKDSIHNTPLIGASLKGYFDIVQHHLLSQTGIEINAQNKEGRTPLFCAAAKGHAEIVRLLLSQPGIDFTLGNSSGYTARDVAASSLQHVRKKLEAAQQNHDAAEASKCRESIEGYQSIIQLLDEFAYWQGVLADAEYDDFSRVREAIKDGEKLQQKGGNINWTTPDGRTLLSLAAENGCEDIVRFLLDQPGIDLTIKDQAGKTAMDYAHEYHRGEIVELLRQKEWSLDKGFLLC